MWDYDEYDEEEELYGEIYDKLLEKAEAERERSIQMLIEKSFEANPKTGKNAHAYNQQYDNLIIYKMNKEGKSLQQIANVFGCSKSTIRNRLIKMKSGNNVICTNNQIRSG